MSKAEEFIKEHTRICSMDVKVQSFRKNGIIICVKVGYIAADIPSHWKVRRAEYVGTSSFGKCSYYDIALNDMCYLHIMRNGQAESAYFF